jgi:hypothetical protein
MGMQHYYIAVLVWALLLYMFAARIGLGSVSNDDAPGAHPGGQPDGHHGFMEQRQPDKVS